MLRNLARGAAFKAGIAASLAPVAPSCTNASTLQTARRAMSYGASALRSDVRRHAVNGFSKKVQSGRTSMGRSRVYVVVRRAMSSVTGTFDPTLIRNLAVIAHVDHGKTTLVDTLLKQCGHKDLDERAMDSNTFEKERGITIMSKYTRLHHDKHELHLVDTPGHADFGGEVERIMTMVDGVVLVVDATEGPMSQTKFVLSKALERKLLPVVVLNKVDRPTSRAGGEVENEIFDLFAALDATDEQLDYPLLYASAKNGWAIADLDDPQQDMGPLLDAITKRVAPPCNHDKLQLPFAFSVNTISTDPYLGRVVTGKIESGVVKVGDAVKVLGRDGQLKSTSKITKLFYLEGLQRRDVEEANAGQVVSIAGTEAGVSDTVCNEAITDPLAAAPLTPPVISMTFGPNDGPFSGKEGKLVTSSHIKKRLQHEVENNVTISLKDAADSESIDVQGRGELQLGILAEQMRREGFELCISPPRVLYRTDENGEELEPVEEVVVDVDAEYSGMIIEKMALRKGDLKDFKEMNSRTRLTFHVPSRGLMGFRSEAVTDTHGSAVVNSALSHYIPLGSNFKSLRKGKLVSMETGSATAYALNMVQDRGETFVSPGDDVYSGMVVGEHNRPSDLDVNPCRAKRVTNMRASGHDEAIRLIPPKRRSLEEYIIYMDDDEVLEITPQNIRLRKKVLDANERARLSKRNK